MRKLSKIVHRILCSKGHAKGVGTVRANEAHAVFFGQFIEKASLQARGRPAVEVKCHLATRVSILGIAEAEAVG